MPSNKQKDAEANPITPAASKTAIDTKSETTERTNGKPDLTASCKCRFTGMVFIFFTVFSSIEIKRFAPLAMVVEKTITKNASVKATKPGM